MRINKKWQADSFIKNVVSFENQNDLLSAVNTGKVDAGITDSIFAAYMISQNNNLYLN